MRPKPQQNPRVWRPTLILAQRDGEDGDTVELHGQIDGTPDEDVQPLTNQESACAWTFLLIAAAVAILVAWRVMWWVLGLVL